MTAKMMKDRNKYNKLDTLKKLLFTKDQPLSSTAPASKKKKPSNLPIRKDYIMSLHNNTLCLLNELKEKSKFIFDKTSSKLHKKYEFLCLFQKVD